MGKPLCYICCTVIHRKEAKLSGHTILLFSQSDRMTRPEGSSNVKPTKADIICMLREKGIDCKNDGIAIKKSVLEDMARQAGININITKKPLLGKRPGSSIEACRLVIAGKSTLPANTNARSSINLAAEDDEFLEEDGVPLNQVTGISSTYSQVVDCMKHSEQCVNCKYFWFSNVLAVKKDMKFLEQKVVYKIFRFYLYPDFDCSRCNIRQIAELIEAEFLSALVEEV